MSSSFAVIKRISTVAYPQRGGPSGYPCPCDGSSTCSVGATKSIGFGSDDAAGDSEPPSPRGPNLSSLFLLKFHLSV